MKLRGRGTISWLSMFIIRIFSNCFLSIILTKTSNQERKEGTTDINDKSMQGKSVIYLNYSLVVQHVFVLST